MRPRVVAASTATLIAAASLSPVAAQAVGENTLYVNGSSSACMDSGTGTYAVPYCTLQAAADAVNPGDVVNVAPGTYAPVALARSGTASAPIIFNGNGTWGVFGLTSGAATSFDLSSVSYVRIQNFVLTSSSTAGALVDGGSADTFVHDRVNASTGEPALHVTDAASAVTVQDSLVLGGIVVDGGSTGTVLTTNRIEPSDTTPVSVVGATGTAITSNTITGCGPAIAVTDSAAGTSIENNVISTVETNATSATCPASSQAYGILVDSASASGSTEDYNDVYTSGTGSADYVWAGADYASGSALYAATQQGQHDYNGSNGGLVGEHSPIINSANSAAIGEQPVDIVGNPRVLDPLVTPTGAGPHDDYDRGVSQFQDPVAEVSSSFTSSVVKAPAGGAITLDAASTDTWSDSFDYEFSLSNGQTVDAGTSGKATVSFSTPAVYGAEMLVTPTNGEPITREYGYLTVTVVPQAPLKPVLSTYADGNYGVSVDDIGTTDAWNISGVTFNFGDGTPTQTGVDTALLQHTYAKAGTYTITETVTDQGGNTATTSSAFTTDALTPGTLVNTVNGSPASTPSGSTGLVQSAVTSMPNNSSQLVAATTSGRVEFATGSNDGYTWQNWQTVSLPSGVTAKWVGIAGMPNGSSQLIAISSTGQLWHIVRNANGTWQNGWGTPAGSTGFVRASITAMPGGSSQLVAVTTTGVLMHDIRNANGSWQGWRALSQPGVTIVDASIAGMPDGSSQILEVTSAGVMKHDIRYANGAWQAQGWGVPGGFGSVEQVSIASTSVFGSVFGPGTTVMTVVTSAGAIEGAFRNPDGTWQTWPGGTLQAALWGTAANATLATQPDGSYVTFAVAAG